MSQFFAVSENYLLNNCSKLRIYFR